MLYYQSLTAAKYDAKIKLEAGHRKIFLKEKGWVYPTLFVAKFKCQGIQKKAPAPMPRVTTIAIGWSHAAITIIAAIVANQPCSSHMS